MYNPQRLMFLRRSRSGLAFLLVLAFYALGVGGSGAAERFVVIVNAANPTSAMDVEDLSDAFLKKMQRWPQGDAVMPVDLTEESRIRESFSRLALKKSTVAVKAYWQKMIFSGRDVPPPEKASGAEVVAYVRANRGAIGYVAADTPLGSGVKVVRVAP